MKNEYRCSENKPFGLVRRECAERLFLWYFVCERLRDCTPLSMQVQFRELKSFYCYCKKLLI